MKNGWEAVIGLEIHAELSTESKIFCGCSTRFGDEPNSNTCPVCLGLPGSLPVLNWRAVELGARAALALGLRINEVSIFARKNYFYPDLPKGYQISQYDAPLCTNGHLEVALPDEAPRDVGIVRVHDLRSSAEAAEYLRRLREVLMALGVNDGNLEEGSFRCDANVSIRPRGSKTLGTRCEIKNV